MPASQDGTVRQRMVEKLRENQRERERGGETIGNGELVFPRLQLEVILVSNCKSQIDNK